MTLECLHILHLISGFALLYTQNAVSSVALEKVVLNYCRLKGLCPVVHLGSSNLCSRVVLQHWQKNLVAVGDREALKMLQRH